MALIADGVDFACRIKAPERKTGIGIGQGVSLYDHVFEYIAKFENGTGANKVDAVYSARVSGATTIDLRSSLTSVLDGSVVSFPILMGFFVKNLSTTTLERLDIGAGSNPFITWLLATGDGVKVGPSGFLNLWSPIDGYAVTAGTGDILNVATPVGTPSWDILILGRSA